MKFITLICLSCFSLSSWASLDGVFLAAKRCDRDRIRHFIKSDKKSDKFALNVNSQDIYGYTPLMQVVMNTTRSDNFDYGGDLIGRKTNINDCVDTVEFLLENGAKINLLDKEKNSALIRSLMNEHVEIAQVLIKAGADIKIQNADRESALSITQHWLDKYSYHREIDLNDMYEEREYFKDLNSKKAGLLIKSELKIEQELELQDLNEDIRESRTDLRDKEDSFKLLEYVYKEMTRINQLLKRRLDLND